MDFSLYNSNTADNAPIRQPAQSWSRRNLAVLGEMEIPDATAKGCEEGGF